MATFWKTERGALSCNWLIIANAHLLGGLGPGHCVFRTGSAPG
ncbi:hypothetical protein [Pseudomonas simiae]|jgi:hypothetical protein|nr:hypothetical protein [Pseudomonas simiae]WLH21408.1 hypothetical protein PSH75_18825 [Pseudomonas simiae]WLI03956.1 hypothetical protein PSH95_17805 [Pseudomonas simiae]SFA85252.1 hypothetical protein SAMN05216248_101837 [Pseudomonas simiae]VVO28058.1 hypothetical protein PS706_04800 [Pseudomonas fluorescens]